MRVRTSSFLVALALLAVTCGGGGGGTASPAPTRGGTLTVAIWQEPNTLHYYYATQTIATFVLETAVEGLIKPGPDGDYLPVLAREVPTVKNSGVKLSPDGKKMDVTYHLVTGVQWSDGQPLTSADVQFTWESIVKDPKVTSREGYDKIEGVDASDPNTVVIHFKEVYAPYAALFYAILPKHLLQGVADVSKSDYVFKPLGTGPFKITEFKAADHVTAERNPLYRVKGKPLLDRIIFRSVPSREVAVAQLKAGEVQAMWNLLEAQLPDLEKNTDIKILNTPSPSVERLEFNLSRPGNPADPKVPHPVLSDVKVREALELATPKAKIIQKLLFGKATAAQTTLSIGIYSPKDVKQEDYNPQKANQLLDQAGWTKGPDGIRSKGGVRAHLSITTTTGDKIREQVEQVLIDEWRQIGIELEIKNVPSSVLFGSWSAGAPRKRGNFDINMYASSPDPDPQATIAGRFASKNIPRPENNGAGFNYYRYSNPEVDRLIDQAGATIDVEKRKQIYSQILRDLENDHVGVWLYNRGSIDAFRTSMGGYKPNGWDNVTWTTQDWYVSK